MAIAIQHVGIDVGALFLKAVRTDSSGNVCETFYRKHHGEPAKVLDDALAALSVGAGDFISMTGVNARAFAHGLGAAVSDMTYCQIEAIRRLVRDCRYVMDIGGGSATLIQLDRNGNFQGYATNSLCAAGTGSFLDEQLGRLGISYDDAKKYAHNPHPPTIATRCSVFAKSDLIHRQQEGCSKMDMWSGLCRGMTRTLLSTLLSGRPLDGKTAVIGGVALNAEVVRWLEEAYPGLIVVPPMPHLVAAVGAALNGRVVGHHPVGQRTLSAVKGRSSKSGLDRFPWPLAMEKSHYPSFATDEAYDDDDANEVRVTSWKEGQDIRGYLGIDVGSTSTKALLADEQGRVIVDVYRKTAGDPIGATKRLFKALRVLAERKRARLEILGVGTTGSGRKIVGIVIGADAIINEISAHVAGAARTDSSIDTIFEIGGQDSKYMYLVDGHIRDSNMNYVCAAGTGSFVEEQANKLGYKVADAGPAVMGICPPRATDRCTVFMEQDMQKLIQSGATPEEAFAAVMVAVTKNYLNKVVGNRYRSRKKIFFQGATARNPALVAAFERLLDVEIVVSPYCHVMGAYGVALLTCEMMVGKKDSKTSFRGLDLEKRQIRLEKGQCDLCQNHCAITAAAIEGLDEKPSWGYMCGRDPAEKRVRVTPHARLLRLRQKLWQEGGAGTKVPEGAPIIGIPQALVTYTYLPLWRRFFNRLGYQIQLSGPTTQAIRELGTRLSGADFCFPAKVFLGHAAALATREGVDFIFLPQMMNEVPSEHVTAATFCPYVQASPGYCRSAFKLNGLETAQILAPLVDMRLEEGELAKKLAQTLSRPLQRSVGEIEEAWKDGIRVQGEFRLRCLEEGQRVIHEAREKNEKLLVLVGRPYNTYDPGLNLGLPQKIAEQGRTVIPMEFLSLDLSRLGARYRNIYWSYGQKILAALEEISKSDLFDAIYFTNFSCGPDSFLLSYAAEIMGNKPFLALELDEHGADAGYMTRIEAFFDVLRRPQGYSPRGLQPYGETSKRTPYVPPPRDMRDRTLWVPNMHPVTTELFVAALRRHGFDARLLPREDQGVFEIGRSVTRGSECLPTAITIGSLLKTLRENGEGGGTGRGQAFFMPTAQGPCRFGQYCTLHRQILDREGFSDVAILSPTSFNGYQGVDEPVRRALWIAMLVGDILLKARCKVRPYEVSPGQVDLILGHEIARLAWVIEKDGDIVEALGKAVRRVAAVPVRAEAGKPLIGVVGEIYVRNNVFANEDVLGSIERLGGEAWTTPVSEWFLFTASPANISEHHAHRFSMNSVTSYLKWQWMVHWEKKLYHAASPLLDDRHEPPIQEIMKEGARVLPANIGGEAILTIGRAVKFAHQKAALVVNVAPFSCMPGTVTTALFRELSVELGLPIVNLFYDGTGGQNRRLEVFLRNAIKQGRGQAASDLGEDVFQMRDETCSRDARV